MRRFTAVAAAFAATLWATAAMTQSNVDERHAELQEVVEAINDPDPLRRLALLESILEEHDATKTELALRTAFTVDDPNVRSLALRSHFSSYRTVVIEAEFPKNAEGDDSRAYSNTQSMLNAVSGKFALETEENPTLDEDFSFISLTANTNRATRNAGTGNVKGTTITFVGSFDIPGTGVRNCSFEMHSYEGFTVKGTGGCDVGGVGGVPFLASIRLF